MYRPGASSSETLSSATGADLSDITRGKVAEGTSATDILTLSDTDLQDYLFGMPGVDLFWYRDTRSIFGLSSNSSILKVLKSAGKISSHSFSWYYGWNSATESKNQDGQLVFGGYDAARANGPSVTGPIKAGDYDCPSGIWLDVQDIRLQNTDGSTPSLLGFHSMRFCVAFDFPIVMSILENPYFEKFENLTGTQNVGIKPWIDYGGVLYDQNNV